jgi:hypothetical protein
MADITRMETLQLLALRRETMGRVFQENSIFTGKSFMRMRRIVSATKVA